MTYQERLSGIGEDLDLDYERLHAQLVHLGERTRQHEERLTALETVDPPPDDVPSDEPKLPEPDPDNAIIVTPNNYHDLVVANRPEPGAQYWFEPGVYTADPMRTIGSASVNGTADEPIVYRRHPDATAAAIIKAVEPWPSGGRHRSLWRFAPGTSHVFVHGLSFRDSGQGGRDAGSDSGGDQLQVYSSEAKVSHHIVISDCDFERGYGKSVLAIGDDMWFLGNRFNDCCLRNPIDGGAAAATLSTWFKPDGGKCLGVVMRRNVFGKQLPNFGEGCHGVHCDGLIIQDNVLTDGARRVNIYAHNSRDVRIERNWITHNDPPLNDRGHPPAGILGACEDPHQMACDDWIVRDNVLIGDMLAGIGWVNWAASNTAENTYSDWRVLRNLFNNWNDSQPQLRVDALRSAARHPQNCTHDVDITEFGDPQFWTKV